jgi:hypothetical protein
LVTAKRPSAAATVAAVTAAATPVAREWVREDIYMSLT